MNTISIAQEKCFAYMHKLFNYRYFTTKKGYSKWQNFSKWTNSTLTDSVC